VEIKGKNFFLVGIKGTGMEALAEILQSLGATVSGSDTDNVFYTDAILKRLHIPYYESFSAEYINNSIDIVVHSIAYNKGDNPQLKKAKNLNIPILTYPEVLGKLSQITNFNGISGVHGKTTTTALTGLLLKALDIPVSVLVGSEVKNFDNRSTCVNGFDFFVAETCEYKRHFLVYSPQRIVITSVEPEHLDYFQDIEDIYNAFESYANKLPSGGELFYCADDKGACEVVRRLKHKRNDIIITGYGEGAEGSYRIINKSLKDGVLSFKLKGYKESFYLKIPGDHNILNASAAIALSDAILKRYGQIQKKEEVYRKALLAFSGIRRRSEIIGEAQGILFMDDYGHHPTAILKTLTGIKDYFPNRKLIVDFMSHTYSRTKALLNEFSECFKPADLVIINKIYASAREKGKHNITGRKLYQRIVKKHPDTYYIPEFDDVIPFLDNILSRGDIFLTLGAGDNWKIGKRYLTILKEKEHSL
jgi:UDP-N-acetylmuramate--alanine ligase